VQTAPNARQSQRNWGVYRDSSNSDNLGWRGEQDHRRDAKRQLHERIGHLRLGGKFKESFMVEMSDKSGRHMSKTLQSTAAVHFLQCGYAREAARRLVKAARRLGQSGKEARSKPQGG